MGHHKLFYKNSKDVRNRVNEAVTLADEILAAERRLIQMLVIIDRKRFYVRLGFNSLTGFCQNGLNLSKNQTQRIVTQVRRADPMANFLVRGPDNLSGVIGVAVENPALLAIVGSS